MYSTRNEGKSVVAERFGRILENKIDKYMTSIPKNMYIDKLGDIANTYNNTQHSTIKVNPVDKKSSIYIDSRKYIDDKDPKFKLVILLEYQNIKTFLQKAMFQIGLKKLLWLKKLKPLFY